MKKYLFIPILLITLILTGNSWLIPCTSAVISGKATPDGRPILWKNRDTSSMNNKILYFKGEKYNFIGLINTGDKTGANVWAGINEKLHSYPFAKPRVPDPSKPIYINTNDTINRNSTASVAVFHGASSPDKAHLATMWVLLGQPVCTVAVPTWAAVSDVPDVLSGTGNAPLNNFSRALASYLYPDKRGHMTQYLNVTRLKTQGGKGVLSKLFKIENNVFTKTAKKLREWEKNKPSVKEMSDFESEISVGTYKALQKVFSNIKIPK